MNRRPDHHGFNRIRATGKIATLLSWRHLRELPWVFRICFFLIGVQVIVLILLMILIPLLP